MVEIAALQDLNMVVLSMVVDDSASEMDRTSVVPVDHH